MTTTMMRGIKIATAATASACKSASYTTTTSSVVLARGGTRRQKRSLAKTATAAAAACILPRCIPIAIATKIPLGATTLVAAASAGEGSRSNSNININSNSNIDTNGNISNGLRGHRRYSVSSSLRAATGKSPFRDACTANNDKKEESLSDVLRALAFRLNKPVPLRASATTTAATTATTIPDNSHRRLAELADELVRAYDSLPPLRLSDNSGEHVTVCERSSIVKFLANECCPEEAGIQTSVEDYYHHHRCNADHDNHNSNNKHRKNRHRHHRHRLRKATTPIYEAITDLVLKQNARIGMEFLIALREDLLTTMRYHKSLSRNSINNSNYNNNDDDNGNTQQVATATAASAGDNFKDLDDYFRSVLARWFAPGLLQHERITYESSPASIIEAIAKSEAVHPVKSLQDLKDRLSSSNQNPKRVFGLFHPLLPNRPLVVVHVALLHQNLPACMNDVLRVQQAPAATSIPTTASDIRRPPAFPETAAFYSISNGVGGLAGVGLGEFLLKETIRALREELPSLAVFVTLSPVPNFRKWMKVQFLLKQQQQELQQLGSNTSNATGTEEENASDDLISPEDWKALRECGLVSSSSSSSSSIQQPNTFPWEEFLESLEQIDFSELHKAGAEVATRAQTQACVANNNNDDDSNSTSASSRYYDKQQFVAVRTVLLKLLSRYLALEKHRGKPLDKVCGFHVGNGAEIHEVRFAADLSRGGLSKSYGLMVNYLYDTDKVPTNQRNFESPHRTVPVGPGVKRWLE